MNNPSIEKLQIFNHPYINNIYLECYEDKSNPGKVLVIETNIDLRKSKFNPRDERFVDLLAELNNVQIAAEANVGKLDRVDIRSA